MLPTAFCLLFAASIAVGSHVGDTSSGHKWEPVVKFDLVVSEGLHNPDGAKERMVYFMNDKFASEQLVIDEGDTLEICVTSAIHRPFTLHAHGIHQDDTPWMDGVPGITQPMIKPNGTYTYRYTVNQHGLYHIHAHSKSMQDDGLFFALYVRSRHTRKRPFAQFSKHTHELTHAERNPHILMINDWRHYPSNEIIALWKASNIEPLCVQSILINGQGSTVCPPAEELSIAATARGFGNVSELGCLQFDSPILNPPIDGFGLDSDPSLVPDDLWKTCKTAGVDNPLYTVTVDKFRSSWAVLTFVNAGGLWEEQVSIDEHPMYVFSVDGEYVNVTTPVDAVSVLSGMRVSVAIKLDKRKGSAYNIRVSANVLPQMISGYAILRYTSHRGKEAKLVKPAPGYPALATSIPSLAYSGALLTTASGLDHNATDFNPAGPGASPFIPQPPPSSDLVSQTFFLNMARPNGSAWAMNATGLGSSLYEDMDHPLIWESVWKGVEEAIESNTGDFAGTPLLMANSLYVVPKKGAVVDLIFVIPDQDSPPHPVHKHFNKFWVIGSGVGHFNWSTVAEAAAAVPENFNLISSPLRDGCNTPPAAAAVGGSWMAVRYVAENEGPMTVHCHISEHAEAGMVAVVLQAMDKLRIPDAYGEPKAF